MSKILDKEQAVDNFKEKLLEFEKDLIVNNSKADTGVIINKLAQKLEEFEKANENN